MLERDWDKIMFLAYGVTKDKFTSEALSIPLDAVIVAYDHAEWEIRLTVIRILKLRMCYEVLGLVIKAAEDDPDVVVRCHALNALKIYALEKRSNVKKVIPVLARAMSDRERVVQAEARRILNAIRGNNQKRI